jgi:hypothetical protein
MAVDAGMLDRGQIAPYKAEGLRVGQLGIPRRNHRTERVCAQGNMAIWLWPVDPAERQYAGLAVAGTGTGIGEGTPWS